jgi:hypothetical protein
MQVLDIAVPNLVAWCTKDSFSVSILNHDSDLGYSFSEIVRHSLPSDSKRSISHISLLGGMLIIAGKSSSARKRKVKICSQIIIHFIGAAVCQEMTRR